MITKPFLSFLPAKLACYRVTHRYTVRHSSWGCTHVGADSSPWTCAGQSNRRRECSVPWQLWCETCGFEVDSDLLYKITSRYMDTLVVDFNIEFPTFLLAFCSLWPSLFVSLGSPGRFSKSIQFRMSLALIEQ